jgi:hypothetical protein
MYLRILDDSTSFTLSNLSFPEENFAFVGKDVYFRCVDLPSVVNSSSFGFDYSERSKENKLFGMDDTYFVNEVDLFIFLDGYSGSVVYVGKESHGEDVMYCGMEEYPCKTITFGYSHFDSSSGTKELILDGEGETTKGLTLSGTEVKSMINPTQSKLTLKGPLTDTPTIAILNEGILSFSFITLSFESTLGDDVSALIESSGTASSLTLTLILHHNQKY